MFSVFLYDSTKVHISFPCCLFAGIAVDGPNKTTTDISGNTICLIKKKGKVKALDEELYSGFLHIWFIFLLADILCINK